MGLITLVFLLAFTALYLSKSLEKKPEFLTQVVGKITANLDKLAFWGACYGLVASVMTLIMASGSDMFVRLLANVMIMLMALPFVVAQYLPQFQDKMNPVIAEEIKNGAAWLTKNEKYVGYAGAGLGLVLFAVVFR